MLGTIGRAGRTDVRNRTILRRQPNGLISNWTNFDWRENFLAPQLQIIQALTGTGGTASGAGSDRESAFQRCLGETAEIHALTVLRATEPGFTFDSGKDGIAGATTAEAARAGAVLEACERRAIAAWWLGETAACPIAPGWVRRHGLESWLNRMRAGASLKRPTGLWLCEAPQGLHVIVAQSRGHGGQQPILGFGCAADPVAAAGKALRELLLMELRLAELLAAAELSLPVPMEQVREKIAAYARHCPALLPADGDIEPAATGTSIADRDFTALRPDIADWLGAPVRLRDVTPPEGPILVALCQPERAAPVFPDTQGAPFFSELPLDLGGQCYDGT